MDMEVEALTPTQPDLERLAERLDCITEAGLITLTDVKPSTLEFWRKTNQGPAYSRAGNRFLYPRAGVVEWIVAKRCDRKPLCGKDTL